MKNKPSIFFLVGCELAFTVRSRLEELQQPTRQHKVLLLPQLRDIPLHFQKPRQSLWHPAEVPLDVHLTRFTEQNQREEVSQFFRLHIRVEVLFPSGGVVQYFECGAARWSTALGRGDEIHRTVVQSKRS